MAVFFRLDQALFGSRSMLSREGSLLDPKSWGSPGPPGLRQDRRHHWHPPNIQWLLMHQVCRSIDLNAFLCARDCARARIMWSWHYISESCTVPIILNQSHLFLFTTLAKIKQVIEGSLFCILSFSLPFFSHAIYRYLFSLFFFSFVR